VDEETDILLCYDKETTKVFKLTDVGLLKEGLGDLCGKIVDMHDKVS
jgi:hypothetical protein